MARPKEKLADPVDQWEADAKLGLDASGFSEARCHLCSTKYTMIGRANASLAMLRVTRDLGNGDSPLDPVWLAQCVVAAEEEKAT